MLPRNPKKESNVLVNNLLSGRQTLDKSKNGLGHLWGGWPQVDQVFPFIQFR
jgi:hypothetical protein